MSESLGQYIARKRKARELTQGELAVILRRTRAWVASIETDRRPLAPAAVYDLARALRVRSLDIARRMIRRKEATT